MLFSSILISCVKEEDTDIPYVDKPTYKETYKENYDLWVKFSEVGDETWVLDPRFGNPYDANDPNPCAKMSGYSGSNNPNIDWLISPAQDLSKYLTVGLGFDNAYKYTGAPIEVYVSNNYSGAGDPNAVGVTWKKITGATLSPGNYDYAFSGILDISEFAGLGNETVYIAFKYTSTASDGSTWEIDNVKLYGN